MRKYLLLLLVVVGVIRSGSGQPAVPAEGDSVKRATTSGLKIGGFVDTYWGFHSSRPASGDVAYFVSSARHHETTINLAYINMSYEGENLRARLVPAFGTFMNANFANEPATLRNLLEANVGVLLHKQKKIWIDAGVLESPYTNETAVSKGHLMYTRSLAPEHVPYYLSGVKLTVPLHAKWSVHGYLINGWQLIQDNNRAKAFGSQLTYRPAAQAVFNWNTFVGDERSAVNPDFRMRWFTDVSWVYQSAGRWAATACVYAGRQNRVQGSARTWWQANVIGRYAFTSRVSLSGRVEYFDDASQVVVQRVFTDRPFSTFSGGLCLNVQVHERALFRVEGRQFYSPDSSLPNSSNQPAAASSWLMASLAAWF